MNRPSCNYTKMDEKYKQLYQTFKRCRCGRSKKIFVERVLPDVVWHRIHLALLEMCPPRRSVSLIRATQLVLLLSRAYYDAIWKRPHNGWWNDIFEQYTKADLGNIRSLSSRHCSFAYIKYFCDTFNGCPVDIIYRTSRNDTKINPGKKVLKKLEYIFAHNKPYSYFQRNIYWLVSGDAVAVWQMMDEYGWANAKMMQKRFFHDHDARFDLLIQHTKLLKAMEKFKTVPPGYHEFRREQIGEAKQRIAAERVRLRKFNLELTYEIKEKKD